METILAGDIGGTNTRLAVYPADNPNEPLLLRVYVSADYESLQQILGKFLREFHGQFSTADPTRAAFGVAGPVDDSIVKITNLPWVVDKAEIRAQLSAAKVALLNDFEALCHAVPHLTSAELRLIGGGQAMPGHPMAVMGAGTGLGQGFILPHDGNFVVVSSEGGHSDFAPRDPLQIRMLTHLAEKYGRVSWERILSGAGLVNIYEFLREGEGISEDGNVRSEMQEADPAPVITRHGLAGADFLCTQTLNLFCNVYGAEAGNMALRVLARGGVYLAGGIAAHIVEKLDAGEFRDGFEHKGRFREFLETVPTYVILHEQPGLTGAARVASNL